MVLFLLAFFALKICSYTTIFLFLFLCIYHYHHKQAHYQILFSISFQFFPYLLYFLSNCLPLILKDIFVLPSNFLTQPIICGSFMHNGPITSLSVYLIKYLKEFFEPYDSSLETNILVTSMLSILFL